MYAFLRRYLFLLMSLPAISVCAQPQTVRIRVLEQNRPAALTVEAASAPLAIYSGVSTTPLGRIAQGEVVTIRPADGQLVVEGKDLRVPFLRLIPERGGTAAVTVTQGRERSDARSYPGELTIAPDPKNPAVLRVINTVDVEDYVAAVLPKEYGLDDLEGTKAMAVVIRTYALRAGGKYGSDYDHTDHIGSQVYQGVGPVTPLTRAAAQATRGQILTYRGAPIDATYSASSGGYTANNEDVWQGAPLPYLRAKPDPYEDSPHEQWTSSIPSGKLLPVLSKAYGGTVEGFSPGPRGTDGRVRFVRLQFAQGKRRDIAATAFRALLNRHFGVQSLKSTRFTVQRTGETYQFSGAGFGHGVGLSQWGAHAMAKRGFDYKEILSFYYTGVRLENTGPVIRAAAL